MSFDSLCLVRGADLEVPHAGRTQQVFLPRERLERCKRTNGLARNAWQASVIQSEPAISVRTKPVARDNSGRLVGQREVIRFLPVCLLPRIESRSARK